MALSAGQRTLPTLPMAGLAALMVGIQKGGGFTAIHFQKMAVRTFLTDDRPAQ